MHTTQEENGRLREAVVGLRGLVDQVVGDRETLRERMEARIEKVKTELGEDASRPEIARAYVRDLLAEKLSDPEIGMSAGKMVGAALGLTAPLAFALAAAAWLVSRRVGSKARSRRAPVGAEAVRPARRQARRPERPGPRSVQRTNAAKPVAQQATLDMTP